jgi:hypothetical protein
MKPLPDLDDTGAMAIAGRRSVLGKARNEAAEALRDAFMQCQSADIATVSEPAHVAITAAQRLIEVSTLWNQLT